MSFSVDNDIGKNQRNGIECKTVDGKMTYVLLGVITVSIEREHGGRSELLRG